MTGVRVAELESLFTADVRPFEKDAQRVETRQKALDGKKATTVVDADISKATTAFGKAESGLKALQGADAEMQVTADTSKAERNLDSLEGKIADAGTAGGERAGDNLGAKVVAALATIPVVGAGVKLGQALIESIGEGMQSDVTADLFGARTGLDEATTAKLGAAAGEAYAENFGASTEANLDAARAAIDAGLLDPAATARDAQAVIQSLSGVAGIIGEEIPALSRAASQILRTGLAKDVGGAFDLIVKGQQAGLNASEDLLDTFNEYGTQFRVLGLEGPQAVGLLSQAVRAGARDTDIAADSLKEFAIRSIDDSELTARGFKAAGLSAREMADDIAAGGPRAAKALEQTLDGLREIEDPVKRNAAAVALFGTQAEDLGEALFAMDLTNAVDQLGAVEGAADRALSRLGDNAKNDLDAAVRDIDLASTQIKASIATAFAPDAERLAEFVSNNREEVVSTLFDAADAAVGFGIALGEAAATGTEVLGDFLGGPVAGLIDGMAAVAVAVDKALPGDQESEDFRAWADDAVAGLKDTEASTDVLAESIRFGLIEGALEPAQEKLKDLRIPAETAARLSDATGRLTGGIEDLGYAFDGSKLSLELLDGQFDTSTRSGSLFDKQAKRIKGSLTEQVQAAAEAGESQASLRDRVNLAREAFIAQMEALGLTRGQAKALADQYGLIPKKVVTEVTDNGSARRIKDDIDNIPSSKTITITTIQQVFGPPVGTGTVLKRAGGGPVPLMPGSTPGMDTVPSLLVPDEHVLTVDDVKAAGGHGAIYRWRAMLRAGVAKFRDGGAVGSSQRVLDRARDEVERQRDRVVSAREAARRAEGPRAELEADRLVDQRERALDRATARLRAARDLARRATLAQDRVDKLADISKSVSSGLVGEFSLADAAATRTTSTTNAFGETSSTTTDPTARGIAAAVRATASRILTFGKKLKALARAGLKGRALSEIEALGSVVGIAVADEFLSDRKQIAALNSAYSELDKAGDFAGQAVTEGYYKGGLSQAKGIADGLEKEAERLGRAIARGMGIKARAGGGSTVAGEPYLVGEVGPEIIWPDRAGFVMTAQQTRRLTAAASGQISAGALSVTSTATFTDAQVAVLARAVRDGAATGLAGHERTQSRAARYVRGI